MSESETGRESKWERERETHWIFKKVDERSIEFSQTAEEDSTFDHEVGSSDQDSEHSPREMLIREIAHPQWSGSNCPVEL